MPADYHKLMSLGAVEREQEWSERDTMLYALGLGLGADPVDRRGLRFVTEKGLEALPTMATVLGWDM
ncbi:MAG: 3-alpha,7-alpha,12-alpha-trihydroxy-5-beta-cholest-24-enoyl-CoA hydratase, partial [Alphaproteobacteria bacterium]